MEDWSAMRATLPRRSERDVAPENGGGAKLRERLMMMLRTASVI